jgi:hypothetical protein
MQPVADTEMQQATEGMEVQGMTGKEIQVIKGRNHRVLEV